MERIKFINSKNQIFTASYDENARFIINSLGGLRAADIQIVQSSGYLQHGATYGRSLYGVRPIPIQFYYSYFSTAEFYKTMDGLQRVFNPMLGEGVLIYENDHHSRMIRATVTEQPDIASNTGLGLRVIGLELTAHDPFFEDLIETRVRMADFVGGLKFPHRMPMRFGKRGDSVTINNSGDAPAPIRCEFRGAATNPALKNDTTGEALKVVATIAAGDTLVIDTAYGKKTVTIERGDGTIEDATNSVDDEQSSFFSLALGSNRLSFSADTGAPVVYVNYKRLYGNG
ncbi:phage distal tail protein [Christensenella tenuis]|uniref:Phage tail family protein n=1 Tax=Christensenella tenuis TaxID=2763033 RepID=A0ABR7ECQ9_9FIRM|nr:phage tail domain-containing protein [Christensenella tenuis]MBC5647562.1 phage tail family protein [Christensenella tenuis]